MKKFLLLALALAAAALAAASGCGRTHHGKPGEPTSRKFMDIAALYCVKAVNTVETCDCNGLRTFNDPVPLVFLQGNSSEDTSSGQFSGGGLNFGGLLDTNGRFTAMVMEYDENISMISYDSDFLDLDDDYRADYHETLDPTHLTIEYNVGACCNAQGGESIITLEGNRASTCSSNLNMASPRFRSDYPR